MNSIISGVYLVSKVGTYVRLINKVNDTKDMMDYFEFKRLLIAFFDSETIRKINDYICLEEKVIIDFDKKKALLVKDKPINFTKNFLRNEMSIDAVLSYYAEHDNDFTLINNEDKTNLGDQDD